MLRNCINLFTNLSINTFYTKVLFSWHYIKIKLTFIQEDMYVEGGRGGMYTVTQLDHWTGQASIQHSHPASVKHWRTDGLMDVTVLFLSFLVLSRTRLKSYFLHTCMQQTKPICTQQTRKKKGV